MSLEHFIAAYGYLALVAGTFLEGETILVLGGFAAHRGYLSLPGVILAAFVGSLAGDQLFFLVGRLKGRAFLAERPRWRDRLGRAERFLERHRIPFILGFRFVYGIRTVTPFAIGASRIPAGLFVALNAAGALAWAVAFGLGGYFFGAALSLVLGEVRRYERVVIEAGVLLFLVGWLVRLRLAARRGM